jgi:cobaltochelatase CobS
MTVFDKELLEAIEREHKGLKGILDTSLVPENLAEVAERKPPSAPAYWPRYRMFSEVFGGLPKGRVDIPVPDFRPEDWPAEARAMIPALPSFWVHNLDTMYGIAVAVLCNDTTLLTGPTGTGKTASLFAFGAVCCIPVWVTSCFRRMEATDFLGSSALKADPISGANTTEYNPTQVVNSLRHGGLCVIDEAFRSPVLMALQSLLESRHTLVLAEADGLSESERVLVADPGRWWIALTDNTCGTGDHTGSYDAEVQDLSTLDRITTTLYVDYNDPKTERSIVSKACPTLDKPTVKSMVQVAGLIRDAFKKGTVQQTMSMRALLAWATKTELLGGDLHYTFTRSYFAKLDPDSAAIAAEVWRQVFGTPLSS